MKYSEGQKAYRKRGGEKIKKYRIKLKAEWIVKGFNEGDALEEFILSRRELDQEGSYTFDNMIRDNAEINEAK